MAVSFKCMTKFTTNKKKREYNQSEKKKRNGQRTWLDFFLKKKYKWTIMTWKDALYH